MSRSLLRKFVGAWKGEAQTWFEPGAPPATGPVEGTIRAIHDGNLLLHQYRGRISGDAHEGFASLGYDEVRGGFVVVWSDTFHMSRGVMLSTSDRPATKSGFSVLGRYAAPPGPPWGWRTEFAVRGKRLVIAHFNRTPDGQETRAIEIRYARTARAAPAVSYI